MGRVTASDNSGPRNGKLPPEVLLAAGSMAAVLLLLLVPIRIYSPGDLESKASCGNAFSLNLRPWSAPSDGDYLTSAFRSCTTQRGDRLAASALIMSATVLVLSGLAVRRRQPVTETT